MVFVTVGSQKFQFDRLLKAVDQCVASGSISTSVFAQTGYSEYRPKHYEYASFIDRADFKARIDQCDTLVTHGGTGTIIEALKMGKKVVAVPRLKRFGEHVDDHQVQLLDQFGDSKLVAVCTDVETLGEAIANADQLVGRRYVSNNASFVADLDSYLTYLESTSR